MSILVAKYKLMHEFTNEVIDIDLLPKYQEVNLSSPSPDYWKVIFINIIIFNILSAIAIASIIFIAEKQLFYILYTTGSFLFIFLFMTFVYWFSFRKRGYALREKDIIYKSGIIAETTAIVPLNRIQHVSLDEGIFSRIYGLGTLQIHTAGGATGQINIAGIIKKSGIWDISHEIIVPHKIQAITTFQYPWHKGVDVGHVNLHTAAGIIHFKYGNYTEIKRLVNYWLYQIESSSNEWM